MTVLLSGGIDSATATALMLREKWPVDAIFVDYGQPPADAERRASEAVARAFDLPWRELSVASLDVTPFVEMPGRNDMLISLAGVASPHSHIATGVHGGSPYADCSPSHVEAWQRLFDLQFGGGRQVVTPLIHMSKADVFAVAVELSVPVDLTWSCEAPSGPCGNCFSCRDRGAVRG